jgi:hypothetical protein
MARMTATIALPFIGTQPCAACGDIGGDQGSARTPVCIVADPNTLVPRLARDHTDEGWAIMGRGTGPLPLIWPVDMGVLFFPSALVECIGLTGGAVHHLGGCGRVDVGLDTLPQRLERFA